MAKSSGNHCVLPPALQPLLSLLPASSFESTSSTSGSPPLLLITSILTHPSPFLLTRLLCSFLAQPSVKPISSPESSSTIPAPQTRVIFASWLRDLAFYQREARSLGNDLLRHQAQHTLQYLDFLTPTSTGTRADITARLSSALSHPNSNSSRSLSPPPRTVLILDSLDIHLAMQCPSTASPNPGLATINLLQTLRSHADLTILSLSADAPLLDPMIGHPSRPPPSSSFPTHSSPLPNDLATTHSMLLMQAAHLATVIVSLRGLSTGGAKDITGVMRITHAAGHQQWVAEGRRTDHSKTSSPLDEKNPTRASNEERVLQDGEWLYHLSGASGARGGSRGGIGDISGLRVFSRGE